MSFLLLLPVHRSFLHFLPPRDVYPSLLLQLRRVVPLLAHCQSVSLSIALPVYQSTLSVSISLSLYTYMYIFSSVFLSVFLRLTHLLFQVRSYVFHRAYYISFPDSFAFFSHSFFALSRFSFSLFLSSLLLFLSFFLSLSP